MQPLLNKAGLTADILKDPARRAAAIDQYNAEAGGLRGLMRGGKLEPAATRPIPSNVSPEDVSRYLKFTGAGKRIPIVFAAGRATRMKLPRLFDKLGIGGLTPKILSAIDKLREGDDAPAAKIASDAALQKLVETASDKPSRGDW